jgi:predicted RNA-binding Zn ribbon-like protein
MNDAAPLVGEPLAIDLVNTLPNDADLLATPEQLRLWLEREALPVGRDERIDTAVLQAVHAVRADCIAVFRALIADQAPPDDALRGLEAALAAAPARTDLDWDGASIIARTEREGAAPERLAAHLAAAAVELVTDPAIARLRRCEAPDCVLLFLPAHPRRRWCSPERCGNRVRVARYYQRHKEGERD